MCVLIVIVSSLKITSGVSLLGTARCSATGGVRRAAASTMGGLRTESWSYKTVRATEMPKYFGHTRRRMECVLISALKILANQQKDGNSPVG